MKVAILTAVTLVAAVVIGQLTWLTHQPWIVVSVAVLAGLVWFVVCLAVLDHDR